MGLLARGALPVLLVLVTHGAFLVLLVLLTLGVLLILVILLTRGALLVALALAFCSAPFLPPRAPAACVRSQSLD